MVVNKAENMIISSRLTCRDAASKMLKMDITALLTVDKKGRLTGIITDEDIVRHTILEHKHPASVKIKDARTNNPITKDHNCAAEEALDVMRQHRVRHLPLVDSEGLLSDCVDILEITRRIHTNKMHSDGVQTADDQDEMKIKKEKPSSSALSIMSKTSYYNQTNIIQEVVDFLSSLEPIWGMLFHSSERRYATATIGEYLYQSCKDIPDCTVFSDETVEDAAMYMSVSKLSAVNIINASGDLVGIFTERDMLSRVIVAERDPYETPISSVMTAAPTVVTPSCTLNHAIMMMLLGKFRHLPVLDSTQGIPIAVIDILDLTYAAFANNDEKHSLYKRTFNAIRDSVPQSIILWKSSAQKLKEDQAINRLDDVATDVAHDLCFDESSSGEDNEEDDEFVLFKKMQQQDCVFIKPASAILLPEPVKSAVLLATDGNECIQTVRLNEDTNLDESKIKRALVQAEAKYTKALGLLNDEKTALALRVTAKILGRRGEVRKFLNKQQEAVQDFQDALVAASKCMQDRSSVNAYVEEEELNQIKINHYETLKELGRYEEAASKIRSVSVSEKRLVCCEDFFSLLKELKDYGRDSYKDGEYAEAMDMYTAALRINKALCGFRDIGVTNYTIDPSLFSNRAACYMQLKDYKMAVEDCYDCVRVAPDFIKGWKRLIQCLDHLERFDDLLVACSDAMKHYPEDEYILSKLDKAREQVHEPIEETPLQERAASSDCKNAKGTKAKATSSSGAAALKIKDILKEISSTNVPGTTCS